MTIASVVTLTLSAALAMTVPAQTTPTADLHGRVLFTGLPVPGATITARARDRSLTATSDDAGDFHFTNLDAGAWVVGVEMRGFVPVTQTVTVPSDGSPLMLTLTLRPFADIVGSSARERPQVTPPLPDAPVPEEDLPGIVTGSSINGAASPFAQPRAFGNNRPLDVGRPGHGRTDAEHHRISRLVYCILGSVLRITERLLSIAFQLLGRAF